MATASCQVVVPGSSIDVMAMCLMFCMSPGSVCINMLSTNSYYLGIINSLNVSIL